VGFGTVCAGPLGVLAPCGSLGRFFALIASSARTRSHALSVDPFQDQVVSKNVLIWVPSLAPLDIKLTTESRGVKLPPS
jgi:hypothetical protein